MAHLTFECDNARLGIEARINLNTHAEVVYEVTRSVGDKAS